MRKPSFYPSVIVAVIVWASMAPTQALAAFIDFNDGTQAQAIDTFYSGQDVTFVNGQWEDVLLGPLYDGINDHIGASSPFVLNAIDTASGFSSEVDEDHAITATLSTSASFVSIVAGDVGIGGAAIKVYDAVVGGNLLGSDAFFGQDIGTGNFGTLHVSVSGIRRIELFQPNVGHEDGLWFDDLTFDLAQVTPLPEPNSVVLFGIGLVGLGGYCWRKRS